MTETKVSPIAVYIETLLKKNLNDKELKLQNENRLSENDLI